MQQFFKLFFILFPTVLFLFRNADCRNWVDPFMKRRKNLVVLLADFGRGCVNPRGIKNFVSDFCFSAAGIPARTNKI